MKLIVDIDEDVYTRLFDNGIQDNEIAVDDVCEMARALRLGTPLPKEHGRLIDADYLRDVILLHNFHGNNKNIVPYADRRGYRLRQREVDEAIINTPTIIEADKAKYSTEDEEYEMVDLGNGLFEKRYLRKENKL